MDTSAIDFTALAAGVGTAALITVALALGSRGGRRRTWIVAAVTAAALTVVGLVDLMREQPRETHLATAVAGAWLPVLGATGMVLATRRVRPWIRWLMVCATALVLLFLGLFAGAALLPRYLPG